MTAGRFANFKKSLYLYLSSLLGMLLFLLVHRIVVFLVFVWASSAGSLITWDKYLLFMGLDYFTLILFLMLGSWYGIWLGMYWYKRVYEEENFGGFFSHMRERYWLKPKKLEKVGIKINLAKDNFKEGMRELEKISRELEPQESEFKPQPVQKAVVRKKIVRQKKTLPTNGGKSNIV
jgi:hypothetical protein